MPTETEDKTKTKDEVKRLHGEGKSAQEIAEALGKTPATIYNHLRNLGLGHGKRGRPPKGEGKAPITPRPRPGSKAKATDKPKVSKTADVPASTNGHSNTPTLRFPVIAQAIEQELREARSRVAVLEGMLASMSE